MKPGIEIISAVPPRDTNIITLASFTLVTHVAGFSGYNYV